LDAAWLKNMVRVSALVPALLGMPHALAKGADLQDVVSEALSSNPDVAEARNQWRARREEVRRAEGGFLPSVDLNAGIGYESTDSPSTRARDGGSNELTRRELGLTVRQMLFDGWGTRSEVERQQARTDSAAARLLAVGETTAMRATEAYVDLLRFSELYAISEESLAIHRRIEEQIRLRSDAGVGRRADYDQVRSRVALAEVNLLAAGVNLRDARTTYKRVVGVVPRGILSRWRRRSRPSRTLSNRYWPGRSATTRCCSRQTPISVRRMRSMRPRASPITRGSISNSAVT